MLITDLLTALPYILVLGIVPGLAVVTIIAPRLPWPERLASAPGFSIGFIGASGLALWAFHIRFSAAPMLAVLGLLIAGALLRHLRSQRSGVPTDGGVGWRLVAVALMSGLVLIGLVVAATHDEPLPSSSDPAVHAAVATAIVRSGDAIPVIPMPLVDSGSFRSHDGFEITVALASEVGAGNPATLMLPLTLVSLLTLPLGVALLAFEAVGDRRVATITALLALGFTFPALPAGFGDYPWIVDSTLVAPLILAVARLLRGGEWRTQAGLIGAAVLAIWIIHGLEIITAIAIGGSLWLSILITRGRAAFPRVILGFGVCTAAVVVGYILTRAPHVGAPAVTPTVANDASAYLTAQRHPGVQLATVLDAFAVRDLSLLTAALLVIGLLALVIQRRARWLWLSLLIPLLCLLDLVGPQLLHRVWVDVWPWSQWGRVLGLMFFVGPIIAAVGAVTAADGLLWLLRRSAWVPSHRRVWVTSLGLIALGGAALGDGASRSWQIIAPWQTAAYTDPVTTADVSVIRSLGAQLKPESLILNDGRSDAGQWIDALIPDVEAEPSFYSDYWPDDWRVSSIASACRDPAVARQALSGIDALFVGSDQQPTAGSRWDPRCIAALPGVRLVAGSLRGPAGFRVTP